MLDWLLDNKELYNHLKQERCFRSIPDSELSGNIRPEHRAVLHDILKSRNFPYDENSEAMKECVERGWVHTEYRGEGEVICVFPSPLHERYIICICFRWHTTLTSSRFVEYIWNSHKPKPFPRGKFPNLGVLVHTVIQNFSQSHLCENRAGRKYGRSGQKRPPEATYQDEFYRCLMDQLEPGVSVCSEWTGSRQGSVDFYIPGAKWAIELLRDGNQPKEHCDRFTTGGIYHPWVMRGDIQDWLVLDFRHFKPRKPGNVVYHPLCLVWYD